MNVHDVNNFKEIERLWGTLTGRDLAPFDLPTSANYCHHEHDFLTHADILEALHELGRVRLADNGETFTILENHTL